MLINLLVRTSYRKELFYRLMDSIKSQTYNNIRIIVSYDDERALEYIPSEIDKIRVYKTSKPFFYDEFVNDLKEQVTSGYFAVIDDDDVLASNDCIEKIVYSLRGQKGLVCQFSRNGRLKPSNEIIKKKQVIRCKIGMPCLFLHHSLKNIAHLDGSIGASDFHWIKAVNKKIRLKFVPIVFAFADRRSNGVI